MPITIPATNVVPKEVKRPKMAAARPGTMSSGSVVGSTSAIDAASRPTTPISTLISTVLTSESQAGDKPMSMVLRSCSRGEAEPRPPVERDEREGDGEQDSADEEVVLGHRGAVHDDVPGGQDRGLLAGPWPEDEDGSGLKGQQGTESRDQLGQ